MKQEEIVLNKMKQEEIVLNIIKIKMNSQEQLLKKILLLIKIYL